MTRKRSLAFGPAKFAIIFDRSKLPEDRYGDYDDEKREIRVSDEYDSVDQIDTLIHELIHMICKRRHLEVDEKTEEKIAQIVGSGLTEILLRNQWVIDWIQDMKETK